MNNKSRFKLFFFAVIAEMDLAVINLINAFFIGRGLGTDGETAYELIIPCVFLISAVVAMCYNGTQAICSKDYGAGNEEDFNNHKNAGYSWTIFSVALISVIFIIFRSFILDFLGAYDAGKVVAKYCEDGYDMFIPSFVSGSFFCIVSCLMFLEEKKQLLISNIILYSIFMGGNIIVSNVKPSMKGYIGVHLISILAADIYIIMYFFSRKGTSKAAFTRFNLKFRDIKEILLTGMADFFEYGFAAIAIIIENGYLLSRFKASFVAGLGTFEAVENITELICVGFCFLVTASLGIRIGKVIKAITPEEELSANKELTKEANSLTKFALIGGLVISAIFVISANLIVKIFYADKIESSVESVIVWLIRSYAVGFILYLINSEIVCYYKLVEAIPQAHIIYLSEALIFPVICKIGLGELFGIYGFCVGGALTELLTFIINICLVWHANGKIPLHIQDFRLDKYLIELKKGNG